MKRIICTVGLGLAAACAAVTLNPAGPVSAQAAQPKVAWQIAQIARPTNFTLSSSNPSEQQYELIVANVGGEVAENGATLTDTLPAGLTPVGEPRFSYSQNFNMTGAVGFGSESGPCTISAQVVTCSIKVSINAGGSFVVHVPVEVGDSAESEVTNNVLVEGGGAVGENNQSTTVS